MFLLLTLVAALLAGAGALLLSSALPLDWLGISSQPTALPMETPEPPTSEVHGESQAPSATMPSPTAPLPTSTPAEPLLQTPMPSPAATVAATARQTYTVQAGDNCSSIAQRFQIRLRDFLGWNELTPESCTRLRPGQEVFVSPP
ncbi:MAG: LysM peptidoglycan-binding domain-containing protein [Thermoflexales bacterium]|nr:LysM peptidoglycan-binding domain-containing protein [Thermoflexales bacterium]MCS7324155.1 LysM peptidoglycan-binding domain-containing protein [Thermoflexales bacterium]MCX7938118.1 LysM peptidoglycan-binding domain-containing protein [Thermoflexales bacterium]MDW8053958.1 LysM peptidoglycan-binding domain-containing protein [Anaerolineae bacterium]MDW8293080.1 LysM peptidoglycan-binding domain-containing protein [Anaerolineae bacterium]